MRLVLVALVALFFGVDNCWWLRDALGDCLVELWLSPWPHGVVMDGPSDLLSGRRGGDRGGAGGAWPAPDRGRGAMWWSGGEWRSAEPLAALTAAWSSESHDEHMRKAPGIFDG